MILILISYSLLIVLAAYELRRTYTHYNVKWNGSRWVVRDSKGRFVRITRNPWDVLSLI